MTYRRRLVALVAANAVLIVLLVAGALATRRPEPIDEPLFAVDLADVGRISFSPPGFALERTANGWDLALDEDVFPAREDRVGEFLDELEGARVFRRVTDDTALHAELGLDDARGRQITVEAGGVESRVVFGDEAPGGIYLRRGGSSTAWVASAAVGFYIRQGPAYWALLRVFPESARSDEAIRLSVATAAQRYALELRSGGEGERWVTGAVGGSSAVEGRPADPEAVASLARSVVDLVGSGYYGGDAWEELPFVARVSFTLADGRSFAVEVRDRGEFLVARPEGPALPGERYGGLSYTLDRQAVRRLSPELDRLVVGE